MPTLTVTCGFQTRCQEFPVGTRLYDALLLLGFDAGGACGGHGTCGKCGVEILYENRSVSACHTFLQTDLSIELRDTAVTDAPQRSARPSLADCYGIAMDLGTTSLVFYLYSLSDGKKWAFRSLPNPQRRFWADVITRIDHCREGFLPAQRDSVRQALNEVIADWKREFGFSVIERVVVAGNPTMSHLFWGISPEGIGVAPYVPAFLERKTASGNELGIEAEKIVLLPSISAFLGGDMVAGALTVSWDLHDSILLIDLGTNGEIILGHQGRFFGCSAATGPAFEGANLACGMGGWPGAICRVGKNGDDLVWKTIAEEPPIGLCGSGLVDLISCLVAAGLIDDSGAFDPESTHPLRSRLCNDTFYLTETVYLTQKDIRQFQLAKAAIRTAVETLLAHVGIEPSRVDQVVLAGGFGFYLDPDAAFRTGLLPEVFRGKTLSAGNTSGTGAVLCLLDPGLEPVADRWAQAVETLDLMRAPGFNDRFVDYMGFGEPEEESM